MATTTIYRQARSNRLHLTKTCGVTRNSAYTNLDFELTAELADTIRTGKHVWCGRCATVTKVRAVLADIVADDFRTAWHLYGDALAREALAAHTAAAPSYRIRNNRTGATYLVLGTGPTTNAPHLTSVWVQREGKQGATQWNPAEMMSPYFDLVAVDADGNTAQAATTSPFPIGSHVAAHLSPERVYLVDSVEVGAHDGVTRVYLVHADGERLAFRPSVLAKMYVPALVPFPNADHLIGQRVTLTSADPRQRAGTISGTVARVRPAPLGSARTVAELESGYLVDLPASLVEATAPHMDAMG